MISSGECATDEVAATDKLQSLDAGSNPLEQSSESKVCLAQVDQGGGIPSTNLEKALVSYSGIEASQSVKGRKVTSVVLDKTSTLDTTPSSFLLTQATSPIAREKVSEDGYNWRKYGQKLVKGNEFVRSYYKCTHPNCLVKKQLERSHDGKLVDTVYFGQHDHPKPLNIPLAGSFAVSVVEEKPDIASPTIVKDKSLNVHVQSPRKLEIRDDIMPLAVVASENVKVSTPKSSRMNTVAESDDDHLISKRRKKENSNMDASPLEKPTSESRMVVKTMSEVDIINDGYRWRKYGQKLVKGNPNPRSYYRCSSPGCPVKKHVERASHDAKLVITSYEGKHDHDIPPTRSITQNTTGSHANSTAHNDESSTMVEESEPASLSMVEHSGSAPDNKSTEHMNGESMTMSELSTTVDDKSISGLETGSNEQQGRKLDSSRVSDVVGHDTMDQSKTSSQTTSNEQLSSKVETKSENDTVCINQIVHVTPRPDCSFDEQRMPNAEPVQS